MSEESRVKELEQLISQIRYLVLQENLPAAERLQLVEKVLKASEMDKVYNKGDSHLSIVRVLKVKKAMPTVLEVSGRRYVYEPENDKRK